MYMIYTVPGFPANRNGLANADKMYDFKARRRTLFGWQIASGLFLWALLSHADKSFPILSRNP
jgi:hypothetical protein